MTLVGDHGQTTRGATYQVKSLDVRADGGAARRGAGAARRPSKREYTELPDSLPSVVRQDRPRGHRRAPTNHYEQAVKLQDYFAVTGGFEYDTQVQVGSGSQAIARFLQDKQGFCVHFSFAMAAMARSLGIPARVAVGFAPGSPQADGSVSVGLKDAHAWPELYFEGVGWTRFEPTPNRGSVPSYTVPDAPGSTLPDVALPSAVGVHGALRGAVGERELHGGAEEAGGVRERRPRRPRWPRGGDGPKWWRAAAVGPRRPRRAGDPVWRRCCGDCAPGRYGWAAHGRTEADAPPHTLAVWQELTDTAWDYGIPPDESQTPRKAAARIVRLGHLDPTAAASVHRVADAVEQVLYAPRPRPTAGLAEDVRQVIAGLRGTVGRGTKLRALLAPRSTARVVWALSDWWTGIKARVAAARPTCAGRRVSRAERAESIRPASAGRRRVRGPGSGDDLGPRARALPARSWWGVTRR